MGLVQIEQSELDTLRQERNDARSKVDELSSTNRDLTTKVEKAEADKVAAETAKTTAEQKVATLETTASQAQLKDKRMTALGSGFMAKLGETSKTVLGDLAAKASDAEWETAVAEREELAKVKRDAKADASDADNNNGGGGDNNGSGNGSPTFKDEEVASFVNRHGSGSGSGSGGGNGTPPMSGVSAVRQLARSMQKGRQPAEKKA